VSTDFDACDYYYLWDGGKKGKVYVNNTHLLQEQKDSIQREIATISRVALPCVEKYS